MAKSSVVLSFHEALLHRSDIELLDGPYWLNDKIISFYFEYLEKTKFSDVSNILFISPEVTQCIKMVPAEDINTFLGPLGVAHKTYLFFALNDNDSPDAGGTHWSLLVYSKLEGCFFHLDSSTGSNHDTAWEFASHLMQFLGRGGSVNFVNKECAQQTNGYDCGVHLVCNAERLAECAKANGTIATCDMTANIKPSAKRKEILSIIHSIANTC